MKKVEWITLEEASQMVGLSAQTFQRYVRERRLDISYSKVSLKAKPFYDKADVISIKDRYTRRA